ncbi:MAG TPA: hypothetical protein VHD55_00970 [Candidatus Paceibacterota bacterium]|nr:hypothetical protein [Candidatus Paceibacterota bacterium]
MPFIAIALAAAVFLGGGVSLAADHAKPSEPLYQYKVHVNDNVRAGAVATAHEFTSVGSSVKAVLHLNADADSDTNADAEADNTGESRLNADTDADASVRAHAQSDAQTSGSQSSLDTNASLKADVNGGLNFNF